MRFSVEQWAPDYGAAVGPDALDESEMTVDPNHEIPVADWAPITPDPATATPSELAFVDGVRRVEARLWIDSTRGTVHQGICASYGAGVVRCNGSATVVDAQVARSVFCDAPGLAAIDTRHGRFGPKVVAATSKAGDPLPLALQAAMADLEHAVSLGVPDDCLLVVDGPLRDRSGMGHAVGYVKTHHVAYLPPEVQSIIPRLQPGQRTPVFLLGDRFRRWSWYLRLPGDATHGWGGVVRCEVHPDQPVADAAHTADVCALLLPRYASEAHKDARAPQNLYPIAGLERELRRRLGDGRLLYRALRQASADAASQPEPQRRTAIVDHGGDVTGPAAGAPPAPKRIGAAAGGAGTIGS